MLIGSTFKNICLMLWALCSVLQVNTEKVLVVKHISCSERLLLSESAVVKLGDALLYSNFQVGGTSQNNIPIMGAQVPA